MIAQNKGFVLGGKKTCEEDALSHHFGLFLQCCFFAKCSQLGRYIINVPRYILCQVMRLLKMQCRHCEIYFSPEKSKHTNHDNCCNSVTSKFHHSQSSKEAHGDENKYAEGDGDGDIGEYVGEDDG